eukprot:scaffold270053_cov19-Prasinocladus_malaysianus.AAC.1
MAHGACSHCAWGCGGEGLHRRKGAAGRTLAGAAGQGGPPLPSLAYLIVRSNSFPSLSNLYFVMFRAHI